MIQAPHPKRLLHVQQRRATQRVHCQEEGCRRRGRPALKMENRGDINPCQEMLKKEGSLMTNEVAQGFPWTSPNLLLFPTGAPAQRTWRASSLMSLSTRDPHTHSKCQIHQQEFGCTYGYRSDHVPFRTRRSFSLYDASLEDPNLMPCSARGGAGTPPPSRQAAGVHRGPASTGAPAGWAAPRRELFLLQAVWAAGAPATVVSIDP